MKDTAIEIVHQIATVLLVEALKKDAFAPTPKRGKQAVGVQ
jgi:hypothetical protein